MRSYRSLGTFSDECGDVKRIARGLGVERAALRSPPPPLRSHPGLSALKCDQWTACLLRLCFAYNWRLALLILRVANNNCLARLLHSHAAPLHTARRTSARACTCYAGAPLTFLTCRAICRRARERAGRRGGRQLRGGREATRRHVQKKRNRKYDGEWNQNTKRKRETERKWRRESSG